MPNIPPKGSASQLTTYAMCPRKYAFRYVEERPPEHCSTALLLGTAVHGGIGLFFEERLAGRAITIPAAVDTFRADLCAEIAGANAPIRWKDGSPSSLEERGAKLVESYLIGNQDLDVVEVETPFEVPLMDLETGEVLGRPYRGFFDLVLRARTVLELKTSARDYLDDIVLRHLQLGMYAYAQAAQDERPDVYVNILVKLKQGTRIKLHAYPSSQLGWWFEAAVEIERGIAAGIFPPSPGPLCIECEYRAACLGMKAGTASRERAPLVPLADRAAR